MHAAQRGKDLGVAVRFFWRDQLLQATHHREARDLYVGTGPKCEFDPAAEPDGAKVRLVSQERGRTFVHVPPSARGSIVSADGKVRDLCEGQHRLDPGEVARVALGETLAEVRLAAAPPSERAPWHQHLHLSFRVPLAVAAAAAAVFVWKADKLHLVPSSRDEIPPQTLRVAKALLQPPEKKVDEKKAAPASPSSVASRFEPLAVGSVYKHAIAGPSVESLLKATSKLSGGSKGYGHASAGYALSAMGGSGIGAFSTRSSGLKARGSGSSGAGAFTTGAVMRARPSSDTAFEDRRPNPWAQAALAASSLRAGATDDNTDFEGFVRFLSQWSDRKDTAGRADLFDVRDRRFVRVVDSSGRPVPAASVRISQRQGHEGWSGTTYGDGRTALYPRLLNRAGSSAGFTVQAAVDGSTATALWDGNSDLTLTVDEPGARPRTVQLDVLFALDCTGSMEDEIEQIKATLLDVTGRLRGVGQEFDLRYGAVLYRDRGDDFVTLPVPFTRDVKSFMGTLAKVRADGGGDLPESVNQALREAVAMPWRAGAAKVVFLIGDAPPHMDYAHDAKYGAAMKAALAKGIRVHSVAASGLDALGSLVWRQVAQLTRGKFVFIEYGGSTAATARSHGVSGQVQSNNLGDILFNQLRDELLGWGKDAPPPRLAQAGPTSAANP